MSNNYYNKNQNHNHLQNNLTINNKSIDDENKDVLTSFENLYSNLNTTISQNKVNKIIGEIISFKISDSNAYITIKNDTYQFNCIFWKITQSIKINEYKTFKDGDKIRLTGYFSISKKNFSIFYTIRDIEKIGTGNYLITHQEYRNKIYELGWNLNKKTLNTYPYNIGIITALGGAAIQDILQTFKLDNFIGNIIIKNTIVQGKTCPGSIIDSINYFEINDYKIDILLITRGGGSYEDLVGFSDWKVLEKVKNTKYLTISAVGHQIDNQLTDEICDYKFATPSIAAKFITEKQKTYLDLINKYKNIINDKINLLYKAKSQINEIDNNYNKILKSYDIKYIQKNISKYSSFIKNIFSKYRHEKDKFINKITEIKPTIMKTNNEVVSINDFIDPHNNNEIGPKKIEIILIDGTIKLYYRIISYERTEN